MTEKVASPLGNDITGTGSEANPYATLAHLCTQIGAGDFGYLRGENVGKFFVSGEHDILLVGADGNEVTVTRFPGDPQKPVISAEGGTFAGTDAIVSVDTGSHDFILDDIAFKDNAQGAAKGRGLEFSSSISPAKVLRGVVSNCLVDNCWERGIGGGGDFMSIINTEVTRFCMRNLNQALGSGGWASGIASFTYSDGSLPKGWLIDGCFVHEGWGEGVIMLRHGEQAEGGAGITVRNTMIRNAFSKLLYGDKVYNWLAENNILVFDDPTFNRDGHASDGFTFAVEGTPLHTDYGVRYGKFINNLIVGARDAVTWFTDSNNLASTYANITIRNNTTYNLANRGMRIEAVGAIANAPELCNATNNIFDKGMTTLANPAAWVFDRANNWRTGVPGVGTHTLPIVADPLFISPNTTGDPEGFKVSALSTMRDAGTPSEDVPLDYFGTGRGGSPTVGFYEYVAPLGGMIGRSMWLGARMPKRKRRR